MKLTQALRLSSLPESSPNVSSVRDGIAFVGAGGKTSAMFQLARELPPPVIVSATTHLGAWQIPLADRHIIATTPAPIESIEHNLQGIILVTGEVFEERTGPVDEELMMWLRAFCGYHSLPLLIEADGSRQKPLKAPGMHEPVIPNFVGTVVVTAGLSGLGKPLDEENIHRPEIFARLSGLDAGEPVTPAALAKVLLHPEGGLKNIPEKARRIALLNQADTPELQAQAEGIGTDLLKSYDAVLIASLKVEQVHAVREPIAGVILAGGGSQRYGQPKQLLNWRGEPFVRAVAKTALAAGLSPVAVVTGAHENEIGMAVQDLPVTIVHNQEWESGQASSIRVGVQALTRPLRPLRHSVPPPPFSANPSGKWGRPGGGRVSGAIFLLADQPQVTPTILHALVEEHARTLAPVVAPMVIDRRANPVLFDRATFSDLLELEGDVGGRAVFSKYRVDYLPWHDDALLLDVDTPEHYQRLKDFLE